MTEEVFVDSGAFIAHLDRGDRQHLTVRALFAAPPRAWCTSVLVVSESHAWILHRRGEDDARKLIELVGTLPNLVLLGADVAHHAAVGRKLDRPRGSKLTYVDASSLVFIAQRRIRKVWGTDRHLGLEGAQVVPGPPP